MSRSKSEDGVLVGREVKRIARHTRVDREVGVGSADAVEVDLVHVSRVNSERRVDLGSDEHQIGFETRRRPG
jgi:hypothetical protein